MKILDKYLTKNLENLLLKARQYIAKYSKADISLKKYYYQVLYRISAKLITNSKLK